MGIFSPRLLLPVENLGLKGFQPGVKKVSECSVAYEDISGSYCHGHGDDAIDGAELAVGLRGHPKRGTQRGGSRQGGLAVRDDGLGGVR